MFGSCISKKKKKISEFGLRKSRTAACKGMRFGGHFEQDVYNFHMRFADAEFVSTWMVLIQTKILERS